MLPPVGVPWWVFGILGFLAVCSLIGAYWPEKTSRTRREERKEKK